MHLVKTYDFKRIKGFELGRSLFGPPLMTVYCYTFDNVMVDTGFSHMKKQALEIARSRNIKKIFLTHHHEDHSGNAFAIKNAFKVKVYGHPITGQKMSASFQIRPYQKYMWGKALPLKVETLPLEINTDLGKMIPVHTPGHSKDHTIYFLEHEGIVFSGDLYLADRIKFFRSDEDMGAQIESLKKLLKLDFDTLLCSHHPKPAKGKNRIEKKLGFLEDLYGSIIDLWKKGVPERQIFRALNLKEDYFIKYFCLGNVSMINGVRSAVRYFETHKEQKKGYVSG